MAGKPAFDVNLLDPFPKKYEEYYSDHFSLRARALGYFNNFNLRVFKKSPFPDKVIVGDKGWLYLQGNEMKTYMGKERLSNEQLEAWRLDLEFQKNFLEKRGCKFYFMISPSKANIHSENVPLAYYRYNTQCWGEQLIEYLRKYSRVNVISVFDTLRYLKQNEQLYYKLDNHWNSKGAFYAAHLFASRVHQDFPKVMPLALEDFVLKEKPIWDGDLAQIIGKPEGYSDVDYEFISKKHPEKKYNVGRSDFICAIHTLDNKDHNKPKLLMSSDSFSRLFFPFAAESFGKSINIFDLWHYDLNIETLDEEKPDVYLLMVFEPFLVSPPKNIKRLQTVM